MTVTMGDSLLSLIAVAVPVLMTSFLTPYYIKLQWKRGTAVMNYREEKVINCGGLVLLAVLLSVKLLYLLFGIMIIFPWKIMIAYISGMALLGLADDLWGEKKYKGFRGHFKMLWEKKIISTGLYKAAGGFFLGILVSALIGGGNWGDWFLQGTFLALFANFFNLLDTRPARAAAVYILLSLILMLIFRELLIPLFPLWSILSIYLFWETKGRVMLGDTGAYLLGAVLGFSLLLKLAPGYIIMFNLILLFLHYYLEKYSLNLLLAELKKRKLLRKLLWGLEKPEGGS